MMGWATEIKVRAERRTAELLKEMAATGQRQPRGGRQAMSSSHDIALPP